MGTHGLIVMAGGGSLALEDINPTSWLVEKGFELFAYAIGDSMYSLAGQNNTAVNITADQGFLQLISYSVDPYSFAAVKDWLNISIVLYIFIALIALFLSAALWLWGDNDLATHLNYLLGSSQSVGQKQFQNTATLMFILPLFVSFMVYIALETNALISLILGNQNIQVFPMISENFLGYIIMALMYLVMSFVMIARNIIIVLFVAGSLILAGLYLFEAMRDTVISMFFYFLTVLFMQPLLLFISAIGLMVITQVPAVLIPFRAVLYISLAILLLGVAIACILGKGIVKGAIGIVALRR